MMRYRYTDRTLSPATATGCHTVVDGITGKLLERRVLAGCAPNCPDCARAKDAIARAAAYDATFARHRVALAYKRSVRPARVWREQALREHDANMRSLDLSEHGW